MLSLSWHNTPSVIHALNNKKMSDTLYKRLKDLSKKNVPFCFDDVVGWNVRETRIVLQEMLEQKRIKINHCSAEYGRTITFYLFVKPF